MQLVKESYQEDFEDLFKTYFEQLTYYAYKYLKDMDASKEVVHSVFIKIWENVEAFDFAGKSKSYLYTSVYNKSLNYIRDNKKFVQSADNEYALEAAVGTVEQIDGLEIAELEGRIQVALNKLPEKCRQVFEMSRFEEKKYSEIAEALEISIKTVEAQMSKALRILKKELKDYMHLLSLVLFFII